MKAKCNAAAFDLTRDEIVKLAPHIHYFDVGLEQICNYRATSPLYDIEAHCPYYEFADFVLMDDDEEHVHFYAGPR